MATVGDRKYTRIPPESTGDRVAMTHSYEIPYKNLVSPFKIGDVVVGSSSSLTGEVIKIQQKTGTTGIISVNLSVASEDYDTVSDENLLVNDVLTAVADGIGYCIYTTSHTLVSGDNPYNKQSVSNQGSANVKPVGGEFELDSYGRLRVNETTLLGQYLPKYNDLPFATQSSSVGGGSAAYDFASGGVLISTGSASGDTGRWITNQYHKYTPGQSQLAECTVVIGDSGKTNLTRQWGYFDGYDGIFWELQDTTLNLVLRSYASGSVVEQRFAQSTWNLDTLDGGGDYKNPSGYLLAVDKITTYFVDFQYPSGRIRWGINLNGNRYTVHQADITNLTNTILPIMRRAALPLCFYQYNSGTIGSSSEMKVFGGRVFTEGRFDPTEDGTMTTIGNSQDKFLGDGYENYMLSMRTKAYHYGRENRMMALPVFLDYHFHSSDDVDRTVKIKAYFNTTLTNPNWQNADAFSAFEFDEDATDVSNFLVHVLTFSVKGTGQIDLSKIIKYQGVTHLINNADLTPQILTVMAEPLDAGYSIQGSVNMTWLEVAD